MRPEPLYKVPEVSRRIRRKAQERLGVKLVWKVGLSAQLLWVQSADSLQQAGRQSPPSLRGVTLPKITPPRCSSILGDKQDRKGQGHFSSSASCWLRVVIWCLWCFSAFSPFLLRKLIKPILSICFSRRPSLRNHKIQTKEKKSKHICFSLSFVLVTLPSLCVLCCWSPQCNSTHHFTFCFLVLFFVAVVLLCCF